MTTAPFSPTRRAALGLIGAALTLPGAALATGPAGIGGAAFGTTWRLIAANRPDPALRPAITALLAEVDAAFSPWRADSRISRFNAGGAGAMPMGGEVADVTRAALQIARASDGAFDPTVGPLVARRGFGPITAGGAPDWRGISVAEDSIAKARGDLTLDLCGIAKGRALDGVAALARDAGARDVLIEIGGEFIAAGQHPEGRDWRLGVEVPGQGDRIAATLRLPSGVAVATSGTGVQGYDLGGRRYSHIIETAPGAGPRSVTVLAADAMTADGWATALCAAGPEAGQDIAAAEGIAALFLTQTGGALRRSLTGAMGKVVL